ncbi:PREDICTED: uncharacterized protein LOC109153438 [Ipomoea nil]|uniref:uncharacterized protein LOC109153438 n=1 Tax=Ipomoea nil TaxID=35883 RepID=UPI000901700C|nr:PREDICTED: uncharacterized protein LOC109153438 [Ipomoea nil]
MEKKNNIDIKTHYKKQQKMAAVNAKASSSSSFATDLFGPKVSSESSTSSSGLFESVFGPSSMGLGRQSTYNGVMYSNTTKSGTPDGSTQRGMDYKIKSSMFEGDERAERPCNFSSSIYYGAQEVYSPTTNHTPCSHHTYFKKEEVEDDENGNNSNCASRGNWWQGSLYY